MSNKHTLYSRPKKITSVPKLLNYQLCWQCCGWRYGNSTSNGKRAAIKWDPLNAVGLKQKGFVMVKKDMLVCENRVCVLIIHRELANHEVGILKHVYLTVCLLRDSLTLRVTSFLLILAIDQFCVQFLYIHAHMMSKLWHRKEIWRDDLI